MTYRREWQDVVFTPVPIIGGCVLLLGFLLYMAISTENAALASFKASCIAAGETQAKCQILSEIKQSADSAQASSAFAIGFVAGSRP